MSQPKRKQLIFFAGLIALCLGGVFWFYRTNLPSAPSATTQQTEQQRSLFERASGESPEDIVQQIETQFNVKLYPTYGPTLNSRYTLHLALARDCTGNACYFGDVFISPSPIATHEPGTAVQLKSGATAYFIDFACRASCGASTLHWQDGAYYYQVALKAGKQQDLITIATMLHNE